MLQSVVVNRKAFPYQCKIFQPFVGSAGDTYDFAKAWIDEHIGPENWDVEYQLYQYGLHLMFRTRTEEQAVFVKLAYPS